MKKDIKILTFFINFSFFEKDSTIMANKGKVSKKTNSNWVKIIKIIKIEKWAKNGTRTHNI